MKIPLALPQLHDSDCRGPWRVCSHDRRLCPAGRLVVASPRPAMERGPAQGEAVDHLGAEAASPGHAIVAPMRSLHRIRSSAVLLAVVATSLALTALTALPAFGAGVDCARSSCESVSHDPIPQADPASRPCTSTSSCPGTGPAHLVHSGLVGPRVPTFELQVPLTTLQMGVSDPRHMVGTPPPEDLDRPPRRHS